MQNLIIFENQFLLTDALSARILSTFSSTAADRIQPKVHLF